MPRFSVSKAHLAHFAIFSAPVGFKTDSLEDIFYDLLYTPRQRPQHEAGPVDEPLLILLHGFPGFSCDWRQHIEPLAERGFHVVAPDMRGYNTSGKPRGLQAYHLDTLVSDVVDLSGTIGARMSPGGRRRIIPNVWSAWLFAT